MRSQFERMLSLLYRRQEQALEGIKGLQKGAGGSACLSPRETAEEIFPDEVLECRLLCFFLLVSLGNQLVLDVIEDLGRRGASAISVDEAVLILNDELDEQCERARTQTVALIENLKLKSQQKHTV